MTVAAGFRCRDAIILCADSRLTIPDTFRFDENLKMAGYKDETIAATLAGAGDWDYFRMAFEKIKSRLHVNPDAKKALEETVLEVYETHIAALGEPPETRPGFQLLMASRTNDTPMSLLRTTSTAFAEGNSFEFIGVGEAFGLHLAKTYYRPSMSLDQAVFVVAYILRTIKKVVPKCGGRSDIIALTADGQVKMALHSDLAQLEEGFASFDKFTGLVMSAISGRPLVPSKDTLNAAKERLDDLARKCQKTIRFDMLEGNF